MKKLFSSYKEFDDFLKMQLWIAALLSFSWALVLPVVFKLQGMLWTASIISAYLIIQKLSVFIYPYFKHWNLKSSYARMIVLDVAYLAALPLYFYDPLVFIYVEGGLMIVYGLIMNVFGINYDAYLMDHYKKEIFKDVQYLERMYMAAAGILGYFIVIIGEALTSDLGNIILIFMGILIVNLGIQLYNYKTYWTGLTE